LGFENPDFHIRKRMIESSTVRVALPVRNRRSGGGYEDGMLGELEYAVNISPAQDVLTAQPDDLHSHVEARGDLPCALALSQRSNPWLPWGIRRRKLASALSTTFSYGYLFKIRGR
jgi:hypothetical protein